MLRSRFLWRLFAGFSTLLILAMAGVGLLVSQRLEGELLQSIRASLRSQTILLRDMARVALEEYDSLEDPVQAERLRASFARRLGRLGEDTRAGITVVFGDGRVFADSALAPSSMGNLLGRVEIAEATRRGIGVSTDEEAGSMRLAMRVRGARLRPLGFVRTSLPLAEVERILAGLRRSVYLGALLATLVALGLCFLVTRWVVRPLVQISAAAEAFSGGDTTRRAPVTSRNEIGMLARTFNVMADGIAERIATIERDREQLRAILGGMVEGVIAVDADGCILHVNDVAAQLLRLAPGDHQGQRLREHTRVLDVCQVLEEVLASGREARRECLINGARPRIIVEMHASPLHVDRGGVGGAVIVLHDVTELRQLETMRRDFVANVSHELKTPLTAIQGFADTILGDPQMDPEVRERFMGKIRTQSERLSALVQDLLALSRIESQEEALELVSLDLRQPIQKACEGLQGAADAKNLALAIELPAAELTVRGDAGAIEQIVSNLLDNALKYSFPGGRVRIVASASDDGAMVAIADEGPGIASADQERIFERFYRVDKARSRAVGGTGLGLSIVKHLVNALGGAIELESALGAGSTFRVRLPAG